MEMKEPHKPPRTMPLSEVHQLLRTIYEEMPSDFPRDFSRIIDGEKIVAAGSREFLWLRDVTIMEVLFASGLRVGELCGLTFDDLDDDQKSLRVRGKGGKTRTVYLCNGDVVRVFHCYLLIRRRCQSDSPYIFISKFRKQLYIFRHSFASLLLEEGVDIKYIQDFLGHSSILTTQIYLHTTANKQRSILQTCHPREKLAVSASLTEDNVKLSVKKGRR